MAYEDLKFVTEDNGKQVPLTHFELMAMDELITKLEKVRELLKNESFKEKEIRFAVSFNGFSADGIGLLENGISFRNKVRSIFPK